jgi:hypothetical protein
MNRTSEEDEDQEMKEEQTIGRRDLARRPVAMLPDGGTRITIRPIHPRICMIELS